MISDLSQQEAGGPSVIAGQKTPAGILVSCISLWMPWAQWVMLGWKPIETRTHERFETLAGKRIGIHASKKWDKNAIHIARPYLTDDQYHATLEMFRTRADFGGKVLGTVFVNEHRLLDPADAPLALIECDTRRFGLLTRDPIKLPVPFPVTGRQGIFHVHLPDA